MKSKNNFSNDESQCIIASEAIKLMLPNITNVLERFNQDLKSAGFSESVRNDLVVVLCKKILDV